ncbi:hypothetical protein CPB83DRAFT_907088 [Crepidotus variabilis]|uniref:NACHT domain-containing protein n=1 Tax=Crepidotus variabilis TaxID=179855 RepID=A0A9P6EFW7_9AGAR|nr:hypothetical protein CPB83DRAFT_907088 [Crepidotus variabilis]
MTSPSSDIHLFNNLQNVILNQPVVNIDANSVIRYLYEATLKYTSISQQEAPSAVLPGTRKTALQEIDDWRDNEHEPGSAFMWLTGSAGSGKTAVTQTVSEKFRAQGLLVVNCFFSRSSARTDPKYLFLSLAYQLAIANQLMKASIEAIIQSNPSVVDATLEMQFRRLILDPIASAGENFPTVFIIIDGLDECNGEDNQVQIIRLIQYTIQDPSLPIRFFVASRPELWIQNTLSSCSAPSLATVTLSQDKESDSDISFFYAFEFKRIHEDPEHADSIAAAPPSWPSEKDLQKLVQAASGQFIYAKTVTRHIAEHGHNPLERLETLLKHSSHSQSTPLDRLDALYTHILSKAVDWELTSAVLGGRAAMLSVRPLDREGLSILEILLDLRPGDAHRALRSLHSILFVHHSLAADRETMSNEDYRRILHEAQRPIRFYHKSFLDFLQNRQRAGTFFVGKEESHRQIALGCLNTLQNVGSKPPSRLFSMAWKYASWFWHEHCLYTGYQASSNRPLLEALNRFSLTSHYFLEWKITDEAMWSKLASLRRIEKWNENTLDSIKDVRNKVEPLGVPGQRHFLSTEMSSWMNHQQGVSSISFPKLRLKLWILNRSMDDAQEGRFLPA